MIYEIYRNVVLWNILNMQHTMSTSWGIFSQGIIPLYEVNILRTHIFFSLEAFAHIKPFLSKQCAKGHRFFAVGAKHCSISNLYAGVRRRRLWWFPKPLPVRSPVTQPVPRQVRSRLEGVVCPYWQPKYSTDINVMYRYSVVICRTYMHCFGKKNRSMATICICSIHDSISLPVNLRM